MSDVIESKNTISQNSGFTKKDNKIALLCKYGIMQLTSGSDTLDFVDKKDRLISQVSGGLFYYRFFL